MRVCGLASMSDFYVTLFSIFPTLEKDIFATFSENPFSDPTAMVTKTWPFVQPQKPSNHAGLRAKKVVTKRCSGKGLFCDHFSLLKFGVFATIPLEPRRKLDLPILARRAFGAAWFFVRDTYAPSKMISWYHALPNSSRSAANSFLRSIS